MPKSFLLKRGLAKECHYTKELRSFIKPAEQMKIFWNSYLDVGMPFLQIPPSFFVSKMKNVIDFSAKEASGSSLHAFGVQNQQESLYIDKGQASLREATTKRQGSSDAALKRPFFPGGVSQSEKRLNDSKAENRNSSYGERSKDKTRSPTQQPFKCDQCGKVFKTKYTLTIHLKMPSHTGARPFVCGICGKGFRLSSTLCRHKIIHTSEKPHKCHICQKAFNRSSTLKTHIRTHSEIKEFICDICGKGFHQKGNLRNHALIHTGEKPYTCSLCEKAFNKLSNLKFHMHTHTDNTPYRCRFCKESFTRRCDLKQHLSLCYLRS